MPSAVFQLDSVLSSFRLAIRLVVRSIPANRTIAPDATNTALGIAPGGAMPTYAMLLAFTLPTLIAWGALAFHHAITKHDIKHVRRTSARFERRHYYRDAGFIDLNKRIPDRRHLADGNHKAGTYIVPEFDTTEDHTMPDDNPPVDDATDTPCEPNDYQFCRYCGRDMKDG